MVELTAATATSQCRPALEAMLKRKNFPTKPERGGIPARLKRGDHHGEGHEGVGAGEAAILSDFFPPRFVGVPDDAREYGQVAHDVDEKVKDHRRGACFRATEKAHDEVTGLGDGAESHEAFNVGLDDCHDVAEGSW